MTLRRRRRATGALASAAAGMLAVTVSCAAPVPHSAAAPTPGEPAQPPPPTRGTPEDVSLGDAGLPTLAPSQVRLRVPTRVTVRELGIDLPIVAPAGEASARFPSCNVAEFLPTMSRPGRPGTTFIYAHAREGMFLPILAASSVSDGRAMLGMRVQVFTSDDRRFTYEIVEVLRHIVSLDAAYRATAEQLILQTSEGPHGTLGKTMVIARPIDEHAASSADANPEARPTPCR
jgi:hypothetical protein